ncbi:LysR family transcriptional regulator [Klebsiella pneumoniae]|uniref:LysR family transcriptional regulator n=1 Tax=Klebsiella pneumoniae TaxID=573 RepID=A0A447RJ36_KLEPN|nr:LysR family transcriptional regulator [Klebsiella pneumoniae]
MDKLDTLTLFVRIVERGSFSAAAADLGVFPASIDRGY